MKAIIIRIEEPDFGCEGRMEGVPVLDKVKLKNAETKEEFMLEAEDELLYKLDINEGDTVEVAEEDLKIIAKVKE